MIDNGTRLRNKETSTDNRVVSIATNEDGATFYQLAHTDWEWMTEEQVRKKYDLLTVSSTPVIARRDAPANEDARP